MKKYLITSKDFYTDTPEIFKKKLNERFLKHEPEYALYRDKSNQNYNAQASHFVEVCKKFDNIKSFIHQDIDLALKLNASGVHLTSQEFDKIKEAKENLLEVIISTHTNEEVLKAEKLGADCVTYSPIFASPNKGEPKGVDDLKTILSICKIKVFALGGVVDPLHVEMLEETSVYGFASIRYFY